VRNINPMQRLEQVTPEEMPEVVKVASELYQSDRDAHERQAEREMNANSAAMAAEEVGMPREYMERAAELVQQRRTERVKRTRRRRTGILATAGALTALWGGWSLMHPAALPPVAYTIGADAAYPWRLDSNVETKATVVEQTVDGRKAAVLRVNGFARNGQGTYWANYTANFQPTDLSGYKSAAFQVKGTGLRTIRFYLEAGPNERWRSQPVNITPQWQEQKLNLRDFDHQTRSGGQWKRADSTTPGQVERFSFKVGDFMNDVNAKGDVALSDLRLEAE
jgi:hypothetical protein